MNKPSTSRSSQYMEKSTHKIMIEEAARFNTTVDNLQESGFFFNSNALGDCHWFAIINGTMMSLAWFRERQRKLREQYKTNRKFSPTHNG